jgi:hypothetical protein
MTNDARWFAAAMGAAAAILVYQLRIPPIVGLADQGDFIRTIGRFGYGPQHKGSLEYAFVEPKYIPDLQYRNRDWEQANSEYLFVGAALMLNKLVSKDGALDITVAGFVHLLAFLAAFARLLWVTRRARPRALLWIGALVALTDVGYAAYLNSWYAEPASCIFFMLLLAEAVEIGGAREATMAAVLRWSLWSVLWILAKPQNAPIGLVVGLFTLRLATWTLSQRARLAAIAGGCAMLACAVFNVAGMPRYGRQANTYGMIFSGILAESKNPQADLRALGLDPQLARYAGTGAWSPETCYPQMAASGALTRVNTFTVLRFYLLRPARMWRRLHSALPRAASLRLTGYGNFEPSAGLPPKTLSNAFSLWRGFHESALAPGGKWIFFGLAVWPLLAAWRWLRSGDNLRRRHIELVILLPLCCLSALLTAVYGDAFDMTKHLYLFNLLLDTCLLYAAAAWMAAVGAR